MEGGTGGRMNWSGILRYVLILLLSALVLTPFISYIVGNGIRVWWKYKITFYETILKIFKKD